VFSAHCHDDLGLAVANTLAAIQGGVRQVECTINGIGERAGNAALEEIVMAMRVRQDRMPFDTSIESAKLFETSQLLAKLADEPVQANKAIVGRNAFAHEAGIHQDGVLKDARTYEIMRPQDVGQQPEQLVIGRHSGRHAVQRRCDALGLQVTPEELEPQIHSTGFFRAKSKALIGMAQALVKEHCGEVPARMDALVALPGVGRKTANVVLGHALGVPGLPVDRHVLRVSNRIGIAESDTPEAVEQQLCDALPPKRWTRASDTLILHGRRICKPKPLCDQCAVRDECLFYESVVSRQRTVRPPKKSRESGRLRTPRR
jgi:endonuclease III